MLLFPFSIASTPLPTPLSSGCAIRFVDGESAYHETARRLGFDTLGGSAERMRKAFIKLSDESPLSVLLSSLQKARGFSFVTELTKSTATEVSRGTHDVIKHDGQIAAEHRLVPLAGTSGNVVWIGPGKDHESTFTLGFRFKDPEDVRWFLSTLRKKAQAAYWETYETADGMRALAYTLDAVDPVLTRAVTANALPQYQLDMGRVKTPDDIDWSEVRHFPIYFQEGSGPGTLGVIGLVVESARQPVPPAMATLRLLNANRDGRTSPQPVKLGSLKTFDVRSFGSGYIFTGEMIP